MDAWRDGAALRVECAAVAALPAAGLRRAACWHGLLCIETTPACVAAWGRRPATPPGVVVAAVRAGSPADEEMCPDNVWLTAVCGRPVACIDDLRDPAGAADVTSAGPLSSVAVTLVESTGPSLVKTLRPDHVFWPAFELRLGDGGWERVPWQ